MRLGVAAAYREGAAFRQRRAHGLSHRIGGVGAEGTELIYPLQGVSGRSPEDLATMEEENRGHQ